MTMRRALRRRCRRDRRSPPGQNPASTLAPTITSMPPSMLSESVAIDLVIGVPTSDPVPHVGHRALDSGRALQADFDAAQLGLVQDVRRAHLGHHRIADRISRLRAILGIATSLRAARQAQRLAARPLASPSLSVERLSRETLDQLPDACRCLQRWPPSFSARAGRLAIDMPS